MGRSHFDLATGLAPDVTNDPVKDAARARHLIGPRVYRYAERVREDPEHCRAEVFAMLGIADEAQ